MKVTMTGRHYDVTPKTKEFIDKKVQRLEKYFNQVIDCRVIMYPEKHGYVVELVIFADGIRFFGRESAGDLYSAVDLLMDKMEMQVVRLKGKKYDQKSNVFSYFDVSKEKDVEVTLNLAKAKPVNEIEAFLEMRLGDNDFRLFKKGISDIDSDVDYSNKNYAVLYKEGSETKMVEIPFEALKKNDFSDDNFIEYSINVLKESATKPEVEFKKNGKSSIPKMTIYSALEKIVDEKRAYLVFFNEESNYFNVLYKTGEGYKVVAPEL